MYARHTVAWPKTVWLKINDLRNRMGVHRLSGRCRGGFLGSSTEAMSVTSAKGVPPFASHKAPGPLPLLTTEIRLVSQTTEAQNVHLCISPGSVVLRLTMYMYLSGHLASQVTCIVRVTDVLDPFYTLMTSNFMHSRYIYIYVYIQDCISTYSLSWQQSGTSTV